MSQSDFLIREAYGNIGDHYTGSAVLNNVLSPNPLTSSVNCRVLNEDNLSGGNYISALYLLTSSLSGGMFINIPETKSVSLRIWARNNYPDQYQRVSLLAKHNGYNIAEYYSGSGAATGYEFGYDGSNGGRLFYKFEGYKANSSNSATSVSGYSVDLGTNKWVGLRMDISSVRINKIINGTPVSGTFKDIVRFYTASYDAPDTWTQILVDQELLSDGNNFVPWGSYSTIGSALGGSGIIVTSSYGFFASCYRDSPRKTYFDDFQIFVEDAF